MGLALVLCGCGADDGGTSDGGTDGAMADRRSADVQTMGFTADSICTDRSGMMSAVGEQVVYEFQVMATRAMELQVFGRTAGAKGPFQTTSRFELTVRERDSGVVVLPATTLGSMVAQEGVVYELVIAMVELGEYRFYHFHAACDCVAPPTEIGCGADVAADTSMGTRRAWVDTYFCPAQLTLPAPEHQYTIPVTPGKLARGTLTALGSEAMTLVQPTGLCWQSRCNGATMPSTTTARTMAVGALSYERRLAVDSMGAGGPYRLQLDCTDDCGDRLVFPSLGCPNSGGLSNDVRGTNAETATSRFSSYRGCATGLGGPEVVRAFVANTAGTYVFHLGELTGDLDLLALAKDPSFGGCNQGAACTAASIRAGTADEEVTIQAAQFQQFFLIIDAKPGVISSYHLTMTGPCP